uniref:Zgc:153215 n=1 Tax=Neogobius melanostomus TaxID=47308 RepID=A0A8C6WZW4_9GOBI
MATILRLTGLDTKASAEDIRSFFGDFQIPEGGVFIVGGAFGEAFIAFHSDKDALLALQLNGQFLKDSQVDLHTSSMVEVDHKFELFLKRKKSSKPCAKKQARSSLNGKIIPVNVGPVDPRAARDESPIEPSSPDPPIEVIPGYIRVFGLPPSTTKQDICHFFKGLNVQEVLLNIKLGVRFGSLLKLGSFQDATDALRFNEYTMGSACVEVRTATERCVKSKPNPLKDTLNYKKDSEWPRKRQFNQDSQHKFAKKCKDSPDNMQHIVMVSNLPVTITKTEIKELFGCPNIAHTNVLHLLDSNKKKTDKAFVIFNKRDDYDYAINLSGCHLGSHIIDVTPITKEEMRSMMAMDKSMQNTQKFGKMGTDTEEQSRERCTSARTCVYVRNMPANVRRSQIRALFSENKLREDDITLLRDSDGTCGGEAVIQFQSQTNAALALMHHGMEFLGSKLLLTPISVKQMEEILGENTRVLQKAERPVENKCTYTIFLPRGNCNLSLPGNQAVCWKGPHRHVYGGAWLIQSVHWCLTVFMVVTRRSTLLISLIFASFWVMGHTVKMSMARLMTVVRRSLQAGVSAKAFWSKTTSHGLSNW